MGWTGLNIYGYNSARMADIKQLLLNEFTSNFKTEHGYTVIHTPKYISLRFGEAYMAIELKRLKPDGAVELQETWALVILWKALKYEFMYKEMDETEHPYYYNAPKKLIKMLSPTTNENALEWREKVLSRFKTK